MKTGTRQIQVELFSSFVEGKELFNNNTGALSAKFTALAITGVTDLADNQLKKNNLTVGVGGIISPIAADTL